MSFNVKDYGAQGNAKYVADGVTSAGSPILTSATAGFASGDVGKTIWCIDTAVGTPLTGQTTITAFIDSSHVQLAVNAARTTINVQVTWGTDDTPAFLAAYAASNTTAAQIFPPLKSGQPVSIPSGGYILTSKFLATSGTNSFGLIGENKASTVLFVSPNCPVPTDGSPLWIDLIGVDGEMSGFQIWGPDTCYTMQGNGQALVRIAQSHVDIDFDVYYVGANALSFTNYAVSVEYSEVNGSIHVVNPAAAIVHGGGNNFMTALQFIRCFGNINNIGLSNLYANLELNDCESRQGDGPAGTAGQILCFFGGLIDEQEGPLSVKYLNNSEVNFYGTTLWAGGQYAVSVDGTSKAFFSGCDLGCYFLGDKGTKALQVMTGGQATAQETSFRAVSLSSPVSVDNDGLFVDAGGNYAINQGTGANVDVPWLQAFKNPTTILRR